MNKLKRIISIIVMVLIVIGYIPPIEIKANSTLLMGSYNIENYEVADISRYWVALNGEPSKFTVTEIDGYECIAYDKFKTNMEALKSTTVNVADFIINKLTEDDEKKIKDLWKEVATNNETNYNSHIVVSNNGSDSNSKWNNVIPSILNMYNSNDYKNKLGYEMFIDYFDKVSSNWNYYNTYKDILSECKSEQEIESSYVNWVKNGNEDSVITNIYKYIYGVKNGYKYIFNMFCCDYNIDESKFIYYSIIMQTQAGISGDVLPDSMQVLSFKTNSFIGVDNEIMNNDSTSIVYETTNETINSNLLKIVDVCLNGNDNGVNLFTGYATNKIDGETLSNKLNVIESLCRYEIKNNMIEVSLKSKDKILKSNSSFGIALQNGNRNNNETVTLEYNSSSEDNLIKCNKYSEFGEYINNCISEIIEYVLLNEQDFNILSEVSKMVKPNGKDNLISFIMEKKTEAITTMASKSFLSMNYSNNKEVPNLKSNDSGWDFCNKYIAKILSDAVNNEDNEWLFTIDKVVITDGVLTDKNKDVVSLSDKFNELKDTQKIILSTLYRNKVDSLNLDKLGKLNNCIYRYYKTPNYIADKTQYINTNDIDVLKEDIDKYANSNLEIDITPINISRISYLAARYIVASDLYSKDGSLYYIDNSYLNALTKKGLSYFNTDNAEKSYWSELPENIGMFGIGADIDSNSKFNTYHSYAGYDNIVTLLYNVDYAFSILGKTVYGKETKSTVEDINDWFNSDKCESTYGFMLSNKNKDSYSSMKLNTSLSSTSHEISLLRSIIELYDLYEYFDISTWNDTLDAYVEIYKNNKEFFDTLREHKTIYSLNGTGEFSTTEPLGRFFSMGNDSMSDQWIRGFALSAIYVPMETNLYDASSVNMVKDSDWISEFYYRYGFYRKALYISTDNSAVVNEKVKGTKSSTRPATLKDLLNYDRDIILYIDDNFYNADKINEVITKLDYNALRNNLDITLQDKELLEQVKEQLGIVEDDTNAIQKAINKIANSISEIFDIDADAILKTGSQSYYSKRLGEKASKLNETPNLLNSMFDAYLLPKEELLGDERKGVKSVLDDYEYSVKQSYAIVSLIYRNVELYNKALDAITSDNAIFKSSKNICNVDGSTSSDWLSIYNYYMLANLSEQMKTDVASTLDLDAPIFTDLFGNIVTESGLVIIPAACNATLCGTRWSPYTVGFATYYNNGNRINIEEYNSNVYNWLTGFDYNEYIKNNGNINKADTTSYNAGGYFTIDKSGALVLRDCIISSGNLKSVVQWTTLNKNSNVVKTLFFNDAYYSKGTHLYDNRIVNLVIEVMRGAPIENIDYTYEGIGGKADISKMGIYSAYKLEELSNTLIAGTNGNSYGGNSVITIPNLAFVEGIEVIMLYVYKVVFVFLIFGFVIQLYLDAVVNKISPYTIGKFLLTSIMIFATFTIIPKVMSWSYYGANKILLKDEISNIAMLNYVKEFDGSEIGITEVTTPETETKLYMKVGRVEFSWWKIIDNVLFNNTIKTVKDLYREQLSDNSMANQKYVETKSDGLYVNIQDIFNSTDINYNIDNNVLTNEISVINASSEDGYGDEVVNTVTSFVSPYYVILDQLINSINIYNKNNDISTYSWDISSNGHVVTYNFISPYLKSMDFLSDDADVLALNEVLNTSYKPVVQTTMFDDKDIDKMKMSLWYTEDFTDEDKVSKIDIINQYARNYVIENMDTLGKIPDEIFIKVMALHIAIEFNNQFGTNVADSIEIMNLDTRDLLRFVISDKANVHKYYSYSFARFAYEKSGGIGVIFTAILLVVLWLTSFLKPLLLIVLLGLLIVNIIGRKILFRKESRCIEGYLIGCATLTMANYAYAFMLKITMVIADKTGNSISSLTLGFVIQILYIIILYYIMVIEIKDWKNSGFHEYIANTMKIQSKISNVEKLIVDKVLTKTNEAYRDSKAITNPYVSQDYYKSSIDKMIERDIEREQNSVDNLV